MWQILFMLVPFFIIMYFFMILPNQRQQKKRAEMLASLAKGDKVVTAGGILGTIVGLTEKSVVLRVSEEPPVKIELLRTSVSRVAARDGKEINE
jgi:preprotein translocase subunit YajC